MTPDTDKTARHRLANLPPPRLHEARRLAGKVRDELLRLVEELREVRRARARAAKGGQR